MKQSWYHRNKTRAKATQLEWRSKNREYLKAKSSLDYVMNRDKILNKARIKYHAEKEDK